MGLAGTFAGILGRRGKAAEAGSDRRCTKKKKKKKKGRRLRCEVNEQEGEGKEREKWWCPERSSCL